jgi:hypothetical protein
MAAIVTAVDFKSIDLFYFPPRRLAVFGVTAALRVCFSEKPERGTWHWPERVDE